MTSRVELPTSVAGLDKRLELRVDQLRVEIRITYVQLLLAIASCRSQARLSFHQDNLPPSCPDEWCG